MALTRMARLTCLTAVLGLLGACSSSSDGPGPVSPADTPSDAATDPTPGQTASDLTPLTVLLPAESPLEYPPRVAEAAGYMAAEGLTTTYQYAGGSSEVIQQLLAGNGDIGFTCSGAIVEALGRGFTELRPVFTMIYQPIFGIRVQEDSPIETIEDLAGMTVGISDPAGGEVPIVKALLRQAGILDQVELLAIGEEPAVTIRALENGQVDALGGSLSGFVPVLMQGVELRALEGEGVSNLPACEVVVTAETVEGRPEIIESFLRATAKGVVFGQADPDATLSILREASPDAYSGDVGEALLSQYLPVMDPPDGSPVGDISSEAFETYFDFTGAEEPGVPLTEIVMSDFIEPANEFDEGSVAQDAEDFE